MSNPAKQKGTGGENEIVALLKGTKVDARRNENNAPSWDVFLPAFPTQPHEVKWRKTWSIREWIRNARKAAQGHDWVVWCIPGDRRKVEDREIGVIAVTSAEHMAWLYSQITPSQYSKRVNDLQANGSAEVSGQERFTGL